MILIALLALAAMAAWAGYRLGHAAAERHAAIERGKIYQQWLPLSAKLADQLQCPGRAIAVIAAQLGVTRDDLGVDAAVIFDDVHLGLAVSPTKWAYLLQAISDAARRPRA